MCVLEVALAGDTHTPSKCANYLYLQNWQIPEVPSQLKGDACCYLKSAADCNARPQTHNNSSDWHQGWSGKRGL